MDALGGVTQYLGAMRRFLLILMAIVSTAYLALLAPDLSAGPVDVAELVYALVTPSLVIGGVVLMLRRPGHPIGELLVATGISALVLPAVVEALTLAAFERSGAEPWMWATGGAGRQAGDGEIRSRPREPAARSD
jgi:hypothetical protein